VHKKGGYGRGGGKEGKERRKGIFSSFKEGTMGVHYVGLETEVEGGGEEKR